MSNEIKRVELSASSSSDFNSGMPNDVESTSSKKKEDIYLFDATDTTSTSNTNNNIIDFLIKNKGNITFTPSGKALAYKYVANREDFAEAQKEALDELFHRLNSSELPDYGAIKTAIDASFLDWFGTSRNDIHKKFLEKSDDYLDLIQSKSNPIEFQMKYEEITGVKFRPEDIKKVKEAKKTFEKNQAVYMGAKQVTDTLKENEKFIDFVSNDNNLFGTTGFRNKSLFNELKRQVLNTGLVLFGQKSEEFQKNIEEQFENIKNKKFSEATQEEQAEVYYSILKQSTTKENLNKAEKFANEAKSEFTKADKEYGAAIEKAYGKNELAEIIRKNQTQVEYTYQGVKIGAIIGTTILTGGAAGAIGLGTASTIGTTSTAAALTSLSADTLDQSTDNEGLTKGEFVESLKGAGTAFLFTALGGAANVTGAVAKGSVSKLATTAKNNTIAKVASSKATQYAVQNGTELATDVATSYMASNALGMDTTWSYETLQSALPQFGFQILGSAAKRFGDSIQARKASKEAANTATVKQNEKPLVTCKSKTPKIPSNNTQTVKTKDKIPTKTIDINGKPIKIEDITKDIKFKKTVEKINDINPNDKDRVREITNLLLEYMGYPKDSINVKVVNCADDIEINGRFSWANLSITIKNEGTNAEIGSTIFHELSHFDDTCKIIKQIGLEKFIQAKGLEIKEKIKNPDTKDSTLATIRAAAKNFPDNPSDKDIFDMLCKELPYSSLNKLSKFSDTSDLQYLNALIAEIKDNTHETGDIGTLFKYATSEYAYRHSPTEIKAYAQGAQFAEVAGCKYQLQEQLQGQQLSQKARRIAEDSAAMLFKKKDLSQLTKEEIKSLQEYLEKKVNNFIETRELLETKLQKLSLLDSQKFDDIFYHGCTEVEDFLFYKLLDPENQFITNLQIK